MVEEEQKQQESKYNNPNLELIQENAEEIDEELNDTYENEKKKM